MEVKVYSTPSCPWCVRVKDYLAGLGVAYTNVDITTDKALAMELVKKTKQIGVPVTFIGDVKSSCMILILVSEDRAPATSVTSSGFTILLAISGSPQYRFLFFT